MKKTYLCFFLLLPMMVFAQNDDSDNEPRVFEPLIVKASEAYIGVRTGFAFSTDDFSSTGLENSGFTKSGYQFGLDGAFIFARNMGLGWNFGHARNGVKKESYAQAIRQILPSGIKDELLIGDLEAKDWRSTWLVVGPYISLPEQKFMFDFGCYFGLANTVIPDMSYTGTIAGQAMNYALERDGSIGFAFMIEAGGNVYFNQNMRLYFHAGLYNSYPTFRYKEEVHLATYSLSTLAERRQVVSLINLGIGIAYEFQRNQDRAERRADENAKKEKEREKARKKWEKEKKGPKAKDKRF